MVSRVIAVDQNSPDPRVVSQVAGVLAAGDAIVMPTDTVYGVTVAALPQTTPAAVFRIKRRDADKAIPWLVADATALDVYGLDVPDYAYRLADRYWPGALTLVVHASAQVPQAYRAADGTIALRVPSSELVRALVRATGAPLVTSSANLQGDPAPVDADVLDPLIIREVALVLDGGAAPVGSASTIVSCLEDRPLIVRDSAIPADEIMEVAL